MNCQEIRNLIQEVGMNLKCSDFSQKIINALWELYDIKTIAIAVEDLQNNPCKKAIVFGKDGVAKVTTLPCDIPNEDNQKISLNESKFNY